MNKEELDSVLDTLLHRAVIGSLATDPEAADDEILDLFDREVVRIIGNIGLSDPGMGFQDLAGITADRARRAAAQAAFVYENVPREHVGTFACWLLRLDYANTDQKIPMLVESPDESLAMYEEGLGRLALEYRHRMRAAETSPSVWHEKTITYLDLRREGFKAKLRRRAEREGRK